MLDIVKARKGTLPMALTGRLQFIYENLLPQKAVWDFCCDHGYLGIEALRSQNFAEVYFVDRVPTIMQALEKLVQEKFSEVSKDARFLLVDGAEVSEPVTGTMVVAGVGAVSIFLILQSLWRKNLLQAERLILAPQRDEKKFLAMLSEVSDDFLNVYSLRTEHVLQEKTRARFVYILTR